MPKKKTTATETPMKLWTWDWQGGGYNACRAATREEALQKAIAKGQPGPPGGMVVTLVPIESTLREVTDEKMAEIDRSWASMCD